MGRDYSLISVTDLKKPFNSLDGKLLGASGGVLSQ